ncbi:MAG: response regulator [Gemmatimonadetes bacterium]|nr:response regulator [Gemmatimonadota bacterium]
MACILLLDDKDADRHALRALLETDGHLVSEASDGEAGVDLYRKDRHDLVLLDLTLPRKGGSAPLLNLVSEFPDVKILVTARGAETIGTRKYLEIADRAGTVRSLAKPFTPEHLRRAVRVMLEGGEWVRVKSS